VTTIEKKIFDRPTHGITFDVDWAPEFAIEICVEKCRRADVKATFFATHPSRVLDALADDPRFEVGVHPNFLSGSTHDITVEEVIGACLEAAPQAKSMRAHGLFQSSNLLAEIHRKFPQISVDCSLFLPFHEHLTSFPLYFYGSERPLIRLPFYWEDDVAAATPGWAWMSVPVLNPGLHIYNFHPVHISLNMASMKSYTALKAALGTRPLWSAVTADILPFRNDAPGSATFLDRLFDEIPAAAFDTVSRLAGTG
jgi:hypothetical protein